MKIKLAILAATTAAFLGVIAAPAFAVHSASCGWRTDGIQFYSPAYNEYPQYNGHTVIGGHYYRVFLDYGSWGYYNYLHSSVVYCG